MNQQARRCHLQLQRRPAPGDLQARGDGRRGGHQLRAGAVIPVSRPAASTPGGQSGLSPQMNLRRIGCFRYWNRKGPLQLGGKSGCFGAELLSNQFCPLAKNFSNPLPNKKTCAIMQNKEKPLNQTGCAEAITRESVVAGSRCGSCTNAVGLRRAGRNPGFLESRPRRSAHVTGWRMCQHPLSGHFYAN